jgi:hypothetical protein
MRCANCRGPRSRESVICRPSIHDFRDEVRHTRAELPRPALDLRAPNTTTRNVTARRPSRDAAGVLGWREWAALPDLGVDAIKVKLDTGARTSSLHAFDLTRFERGGTEMVRFEIHPHQRSDEDAIGVEAEVVEERWVRNSGGQRELRPVIETVIRLGSERWPIELTLTRRDEMGFRMLLGRQALRRRVVVDPGTSYRAGRKGRRGRRAGRSKTDDPQPGDQA